MKVPMDSSGTAQDDASLWVIALFWPPVAVWLVKGWGRELARNVLLTLLGFYPGLIDAVDFIAKPEQGGALRLSSEGGEAP